MSCLVQKLLKQEFDFSEDESVVLARNKEPWPKDDAEAAKLWRARVKYELLQGKLTKEKPEETIGVVQRRYQRLEKTMGELRAKRSFKCIFLHWPTLTIRIPIT